MGLCIRHPAIIDIKDKSLDSRLRRSSSTRDKEKGKARGFNIDERTQDEASREAITAIVTSRKKTQEDIENILKTLKDHFIFNSLDKDSQMCILDSVKHYAVGPREIIFHQGQPGVCFFCVAKGRLEVICNGERAAIIGPGMGFGELALLDDSPRTATIKTIDPCSLWGLDRKNFNGAIRRLNEMNYEENKRFIKTIPIFSNLTNSQKENLISSLVIQKWTCGYAIVKEGEAGDLFYIIKEGMVRCIENGVEKRQLGKGEYFGEQALLYNCLRTATVVAITDVKVVSIGRDDLLKVLGNSLELTLYRNSQLIAVGKSQVLRALSTGQVESMLNSTRIRTYQAGETVITRGTGKNQRLFIILKGSIRGPLADIEVYSCIGDKEIAENDESVYPIDYLANEETDVAEITKEELENCIGGEISQVTINNEAFYILKRVPLFKQLTQGKVQLLTQTLHLSYFEEGDFIIKQGDKDDNFYIIKTGSVKVLKDNAYVRNITKNDYFGERAALTDSLRSADVIASGHVELWMLHKGDFQMIIDEGITELLLRRIDLQDTQVSLNDLIPVKFLGSGKFANVVLTTHKSTKASFALKSVSRSKIQAFNIYENLFLEKTILMQLCHPFIISLVNTFKDDSRLYLLTEYVKGIDLFDVLLQLDTIHEESAKFYAASFVLILEYMHDRNIIHRDLKPENIMIDDEGYPKLVDFGTAKIVTERTYTTVGTPHYIAPEIILKNGYTVTVDLWSLGVMLYEIGFGKVPFGADEEEPKVIYEKILEHKLDFKANPYEGKNYKLFIQQLLSINPAARLGGSMEKLKNHPWFSNFNWDRLIMRLLKPPFVPKIKKIDENAEIQNVKVQDFIADLEIQQNNFRRSSTSLRAIHENWDAEF